MQRIITSLLVVMKTQQFTESKLMYSNNSPEQWLADKSEGEQKEIIAKVRKSQAVRFSEEKLQRIKLLKEKSERLKQKQIEMIEIEK